ncbi:transcription repressor OFP8-like [Macadamia integrifolia]|uniref:transcription repressor OFP8-like n=1 Tax=Macadamia integrifolia TaxID=60698 RepID=UPI001C531FD7|nr:transcription repressor OFP8-like [Macadamia integrifolia]
MSRRKEEVIYIWFLAFETLCICNQSLMEGRFKPRLSRMFRASFGSCRSRNIADFIEKPVFVSQTHHDLYPIELQSPKVRTFPSICRPRWKERLMESTADDGFGRMQVFQRSKVTERSQCLFGFDDAKEGTCPPASPISPFNSFYELEEIEHRGGRRNAKKTKGKKKKKKTATQKRISKKERLHFDSSSGETDSGWFSSGDETETFFSSKSFSSDSSEIYLRNEKISRRKAAEIRRRSALKRNSEMGYSSVDAKAKVQESFAVVKRSSDPYNDFRTSMVEMIVEKQIFAAEDLEKLLQCFLSLNSSHHHRVIVEVFVEIWDTLFSDWS